MPLKRLITESKGDETILDSILSSFCCEQDPDIENFLQNRAVMFENLSKSRTYLICDEQSLYNDKFVILGYFTLALKVLHIPDKTSNNKRKQLDGYSYKINGLTVNHIPCYLIGQLARNSAVSRQSISGADIIKKAYKIIGTVHTFVGGRYILIECYNKEKLIRFYKDNLFDEFSYIPSKDVPMVQMVRKITTK